MNPEDAFLDAAFHSHTEWKVKLRAAIAKKESVDADTIGVDDQCVLGKWLKGEGKAKYGRLTSFNECVRSHAAFHKAAGQIAHAITAQKFDEASKMLEAGTPFSMTSTEVGLALAALRKQRQP